MRPFPCPTRRRPPDRVLSHIRLRAVSTAHLFSPVLATLAACLLFAAGSFWTVLSTGSRSTTTWAPGPLRGASSMWSITLTASCWWPSPSSRFLRAIYAKTMVDREIPVGKARPFLRPFSAPGHRAFRHDRDRRRVQPLCPPGDRLFLGLRA